ncbi:translocating chain-associated membrane protein 1-like 1 [Ischnura elegans]|uniref:translocating chain-associated membrane protein 1-like 1 n=1 Tax=Ischnura elegans TaxID=197161 RepID=UPI001ED874E1|nr:translocating chain-associated membrane protein 1-like 1 [Ischnura elegans]
MGLKGRKSSSKNPPILSHEFVIQNHADIVSCIAMVFVIGLMFQISSPIAYMFIAVHHNVTADQHEVTDFRESIQYTYGWKDLCAVFFYFLICIVMHAIIQEYVLDKISRKMHLSKAKHSKFNESGQLLIFFIVSILWGGDVIFRENLLLNVPSLWEGYPHTLMPFMLKFFYIVQLAYWTHCFPELYFQKVKREEMASRVRYAALHLTFIAAAYLLNFNRVGICLLVFHYASEALFHAARLVYFADKAENGSKGVFMVANGVFILVRLATIILSVLTFWYGLALGTPGLDVSAGNFNTQLVRINALAAVCLLQAWLMWNLITLHLRRMREQAPKHSNATSASTNARKQRQDRKKESLIKKKKDVDGKRGSYDDVNELPEVDQNTKKNLRSRAVTASPKAK